MGISASEDQSKQEGLMTETKSKELLLPGLKGLFSLCFTFLFCQLFSWICGKLHSVHAGFHFQLQDHLHLKFGFRLSKGRNYLQCANVNVEHNCPGDWWYIISRVFVEVLYLNSVSLPSLFQAQFTPLLSPKRRGNRGDRDAPSRVTNRYPSGVFKDSTSTNHYTVVLKQRRKKQKAKQLIRFPKCSAVHIIVYSASHSHYQREIRPSNGQYDAVSDTHFNFK